MNKAVVSLVLFLSLSGCETREICHDLTFAGLEQVKDNELRNVIEGYYQAESRELWSVTYSYRTDDFRNLVSQTTYTNTMSNDNRGYCLNKAAVKGIEYQGDFAIIVIEFTEGKSGEVPPIIVSSIRQIEKVYFKKSDSEWKALGPGTRNHLTLNRRMVFD